MYTNVPGSSPGRYSLPLAEIPQERLRAHGNIVGYASGLNAGDGLDAADNVLPDRASFRRIVSVVVIHADRSGPAGLEAQIDIEDAEKAAQQQPGAHEQHRGQRHLRDHQRRRASARAFCPHSCRGPSLSALPANCRSDILSPGARPKNTAATTAMNSVHPSAAPSIRTLASSGKRNRSLVGKIPGDGKSNSQAHHRTREREDQTLGE